MIGNKIVRPKYTPRVIQFGEGNFLRGFADVLIDELNESGKYEGSVVIIQPRKINKCKELNDQNGSYHIHVKGVENGAEINEVKLIKSVDKCINTYDQFSEFKKLSEIETFNVIISNTTEAGIEFKEEEFSNDFPAETFPGKLTQLLFWRFKFFEGDSSKGFHILPCELLENNGDLLKKTVLEYCSIWELPEAFKQWINEAIIFHNALVDRIVPGKPASTESIKDFLHFDDKKVVVVEPYLLWAIEKDLGLKNILPLHLLNRNIYIEDSISMYRELKVKILNGAHTALTPICLLYGLSTVKEVMQNTITNTFVKNLLYDEIASTVDADKEVVEKYIADTLGRFENPYFEHKLIDISMNSISKFKVRLLPSLLHYYHSNNTPPKYMITSFAALLVLYSGRGLARDISLNDDEEVLNTVRLCWDEDKPADIILNESLWGQNLMKYPAVPLAVFKTISKMPFFNREDLGPLMERLTVNDS